MIWGAIPVPGLEQEAWGGLPGKVTEREGGVRVDATAVVVHWRLPEIAWPILLSTPGII